MNISHAFIAHPQKRGIHYGSLNERNYNVLYLLQMALPDVDFIPRGGLRCMLLRICISNAVHTVYSQWNQTCNVTFRVGDVLCNHDCNQHSCLL